MIEFWCLRVCLSGSGLSRAEPRPDAIDVGGKNRIRSRLEAVSRKPETSPAVGVDRLVGFVAENNLIPNVIPA